MHEKLEYTISPEQLLSDNAIKFTRKGSWLSCKYCPFCEGGNSRQVYTFGVRIDDYNYNCLRTSCGAAGSFWTLLQHFGLEPKDYIKRNSHSSRPSREQAKRFVYKKSK